MRTIWMSTMLAATACSVTVDATGDGAKDSGTDTDVATDTDTTDSGTETLTGDACEGTDPDSTISAILAKEGDPEAGRKIYSQQLCFTCHGMNGDGKLLTSEIDFAEALPTTTCSEVIDIILNGIPDKDMDAYGNDLDDQDMADVVAYIYAAFVE